MIGCIAKAASDHMSPDLDEMDEVRWVPRDAARKALQQSETSTYEREPALPAWCCWCAGRHAGPEHMVCQTGWVMTAIISPCMLCRCASWDFSHENIPAVRLTDFTMGMQKAPNRRAWTSSCPQSGP